MKTRILILLCILACVVSGAGLSQGWETSYNLPASVAGTSITSTAMSAVSTGYGVHIVGVYSGVVKHFYVSNDNQVIFNALSITGGEYPVVTNYGGILRVTMKVSNQIRIYQSADGGASWSNLQNYTPNPIVAIYNIDTRFDEYGTHIVWDSKPPTDPISYGYEVYYVRYDDRHTIFEGFKNVTDLASPAQGALPKVTTTPHKVHVVFPGNDFELTSRDLNLETETWDNSYTIAAGSQIPILSLSVVSYGDRIMTIAASDILTGGGCTQTTLYTTRQQDDGTWAEETPLECTGFGSNITRQMVVTNLGKISVINIYGTNGVTSQSYDISTDTWDAVETVEVYTGEQIPSSLFVAGGQFGTYYFWSGTSPSYHKHMRRKADIATITTSPEMKLNWNMASVPAAVTNFTKTSVWSNAISLAFAYDNGYIATGFLSNGTGYWIKYPSQQVVSYTGARLDYISVPVKSGWNLIGSVSTSFDVTKVQTVPSEIIASQYYGYNNGYQVTNSLGVGGGYWVKVNQSGRLILDVSSLTNTPPPITQEQPPPSPTAPPVPSLASPADYSTNVSVSPTLSWNPSSGATRYHLQVSTSSGFSPLIYENANVTGTSKVVNNLSYGTTYYWHVKASNDMEWSNWSSFWRFSTQSAPPDPCDPTFSMSSLDQIAVTDAADNRQEMYVRNGVRELGYRFNDPEMPPDPKDGIFNVRFQSGKFIETIHRTNNVKHIPIRVKDAVYPITLNWSVRPENGIRYFLTLPGRNVERIPLTGQGSFRIENVNNGIVTMDAEIDQPDPCDPEAKAIYVPQPEEPGLLSPGEIPGAYFLAEPYPNPFNPTTTIVYGLKEDSRVVLKVYNTIGQEVATLVDEFQTAGYRSVRFDAGRLTSGVYFCRMQSDAFVATTKLLLVK